MQILPRPKSKRRIAHADNCYRQPSPRRSNRSSHMDFETAKCRYQRVEAFVLPCWHRVNVLKGRYAHAWNLSQCMQTVDPRKKPQFYSMGWLGTKRKARNRVSSTLPACVPMFPLAMPCATDAFRARGLKPFLQRWTLRDNYTVL